MWNTEREPRQANNTQRQIRRRRIENNMTPGTQRRHRHRTKNLEIRNYKYNTNRKQKPFKPVNFLFLCLLQCEYGDCGSTLHQEKGEKIKANPKGCKTRSSSQVCQCCSGQRPHVGQGKEMIEKQVKQKYNNVNEFIFISYNVFCSKFTHISINYCAYFAFS